MGQRAESGHRARQIVKTSLATLLLLVSGGGSRALHAEQPPRVELVTRIEHAVSPPMRRVVPTPPSPAGGGLIPLRHPVPARPGEFRPDPVLQGGTSAATSSNATARSSIDGISGDGYIPPDTNLAAGDTQVVETVNVEYAVYDKATGAQLLAPTAIHNVFAALGAPCGTSDGGDPVVLYDHIAGRWLISQLEYNRSFSSNYECIAVSTSSDATGSYYLYALSFGSDLPDYPKWGVWPDAYYLSANIFSRGSTFQGGAACALPRSLMLNGSPVAGNQVICFLDPSEASFLPADLDGASLPASDEPEFFANFDSLLRLYRFHADFATPSNSSFTGPISVSGAAPFTEACGGGACILQPGTSQKLDSLGDRLMFRLSYRNFGSYESLLATHSVRVGSNGQTGVRWYEVRSPNDAPAVHQQGTYSPDSYTNRWMGSIAQDQNGDIAVGYSVSNGSSIYPGIRYAGRVAGDPLGTLEEETTIVDGGGYQTSYSRWGDYSSMSIDPSDDCTFWYTSEYKSASGTFNWNTNIASFRFGSCGSGTVPATPSGLVAAAGDSQVSLTWKASADAATYAVLRSTDGISGAYGEIAAGSSSTAYIDTGLTNDTQYCYEVEAVNSNGTSDPSGPQCATPTLQPPAAPSGLTALAGDGQVGLSWPASSGASYYNVYVSSGGSGFTAIASVATTDYTDTDVTNGTVYSYYVTAVNAAGESDASNVVSATPQAPTTPDAPTGLMASSPGKSGRVNLSWTQSTGSSITQNNVYRANGTSGSYELLATIGATTSYSDSNTVKGATYCYYVTALNSTGLESSASNSTCVAAGTAGKVTVP